MASYRGDKIPLCYATCSIAHSPKHDLPAKLAAISAAGFEAIELSMPDILAYGKKITGDDIGPKDYGTLAPVGLAIRRLCEQHHLHILMLQPSANFEGWDIGSEERKDAFNRAAGWSQIMQAVGTDMLQIGSSDTPKLTATTDQLASDLTSLADIFASRNQGIAYENWCWATRAPKWKDMDLVGSVPPEKIHLLQVSDADKMNPPIADEVDESGPRPRGRWSHEYRPLPYDGGCSPVEDFTRAVLETGFRGWFSMEVFDGKEKEKYDDMAPSAQKAMETVKTLLENCGKVDEVAEAV